jgi:sec-independent protein translocase protein TatA
VPGGPELVVIAFIAVLLFGANKIPKLARSTGEAMGEFKKGRQELEEEIEDARGDVEREIREGESEVDR